MTDVSVALLWWACSVCLDDIGGGGEQWAWWAESQSTSWNNCMDDLSDLYRVHTKWRAEGKNHIGLVTLTKGQREE